MREENIQRTFYNTTISVNIKDVPKMKKVKELSPNDIFFCRNCSSVRIIVGENIYSRELKNKWEEKDEKNLVVYYDLSQKHIGTIDTEELVVVGNNLKIEVT